MRPTWVCYHRPFRSRAYLAVYYMRPLCGRFRDIRGGLPSTKSTRARDHQRGFGERLNVPLPADLVEENRRLTVLAHNTKVKFGFDLGSLLKCRPMKGMADADAGSMASTASLRVSYVLQTTRKGISLILSILRKTRIQEKNPSTQPTLQLRGRTSRSQLGFPTDASG